MLLGLYLADSLIGSLVNVYLILMSMLSIYYYITFVFLVWKAKKLLLLEHETFLGQLNALC